MLNNKTFDYQLNWKEFWGLRPITDSTQLNNQEIWIPTGKEGTANLELKIDSDEMDSLIVTIHWTEIRNNNKGENILVGWFSNNKIPSKKTIIESYEYTHITNTTQHHERKEEKQGKGLIPCTSLILVINSGELSSLTEKKDEQGKSYWLVKFGRVELAQPYMPSDVDAWFIISYRFEWVNNDIQCIYETFYYQDEST